MYPLANPFPTLVPLFWLELQLELLSTDVSVYAVDKSEEMLAHIRAKNPLTNLRLVHSNIERTVRIAI